MPHSSEIRKAALILAAIAVIEGAWVLLNVLTNPGGFMRYVGLLDSRSEPLGWALAIAVFAAFTLFAAHLPSVRSNLFKPSGLKAVSLAVAFSAGLCEEAVFRSY